MKSWRWWLGLVVWIWVAMSAGLVGARFVPGAWYASLAKPSWTPPDAVFPIVWPILYVLMGWAAFRVWHRAGFAKARLGLGLWLGQLALNALWSWLFFGRHEMGVAFFDIVLMGAGILGTILAFRRHDRPAAALMLPYLAWVAFAAALNFATWRLNV